MKWLRRLPEAPVTSALLIANLVVYAAMALMSRHVFGFSNPTLLAAGANVLGAPPGAVTEWRWLTAAFIHVNLLHIGMNMWVLAQIGILSERAIGRGLFAAAYVATGVFGNFVSTVYNAHHSPIASAGASGAIMGLIGITTVFAWRLGQRAIARSLIQNVLFVLVLGIGLNLDNAAHVGGFVSGAAIGLVRSRFPRPLPRALDVALMVLAAALSIAAFAFVLSYKGAR
jgi:rhomboid protease GluP